MTCPAWGRKRKLPCESFSRRGRGSVMRELRLGHSTRWMATCLLVMACQRGEGEGTTAEARRNEPQPLAQKDCSGGSIQQVDVNNDGRPDITHHVSGGKRTCSQVDLNFDGKLDLTRFYADDGQSSTFEQHDFDFDGRLDQQAFFKSGKIERRELDSNFDGLIDTWLWCNGPLIAKAERARRKPGRVDTWETYQNGVLAEVHYDENNDGKVEKWDIYKNGALFETRIDTNGDGAPDRVDPAESDGDSEDERVSCDGSPLPAPVAPSFPAGTGEGVSDAGVPNSTDLGLSGAVRTDPSLARSIAVGNSDPDAGPVFKSATDAGRGGAAP